MSDAEITQEMERLALEAEALMPGHSATILVLPDGALEGPASKLKWASYGTNNGTAEIASIMAAACLEWAFAVHGPQFVSGLAAGMRLRAHVPKKPPEPTP